MYSFLEIALSIGVLITLVTTLAACVCGCKNSNQKSELVGTAGVVKLRFDEEAPSPSPTTPASIKRASTQNSQRSLPEIPHPVGRHDSADTASEIYATVNIDEGNKAVAVPSTSRDHPYEHAYAKVQNETQHVTVEIATEPRPEEQSEIDHRESGQSVAESSVISASVAISGQLPSSQELPYITPPSPRPNTDPPVHFSGDSTDSAKGYTSISVREPLINIRAQSAKPPSQPHYATVSDDSDEMYAAIEEASVGEGSDTYAQIAPEPRRRDPTPDVVQSDAIHAARRSAPPEVGASTSAATHSRQASSSSCTNSTGALGSPKPEKRQANSPLPPPPAADAAALRHQRMSSTGDLFNQEKLRRSLNEKHQRNNSCVSSSDFYGCNYPVDKHRFSSGELARPLVAKELNFDIDQRTDSDNLYNSIDGPAHSDYSSADNNASLDSHRPTDSPSANLEEMYAKVMKKAKARTDQTARRSNDLTETAFRADDRDPGYETIDRKKSNHGYETIARKQRQSSQSQDPGYETIKGNLKLNESGPDSSVSSDAGYERIAKHNADCDPNYEVLANNPPTPPYATIPPNFKATYSTVNKRPPKYWQGEPTAEPNYESMPNDPAYNTGSESDPNYESVRPHDPNYESLRNKDPKYESLRSKDPKYDSVRSKDPNYESVKYFDVARREPPYEKVHSAANQMNSFPASVERSDSGGYEKINVPSNRDPKSCIKNGDATVSDYFQV